MTAPHINREFEFDGVVVEFIDEAEGAEMLDQQTRKYLDMSGTEFARAFCAGELDIEAPHVGTLSFLLGFAGIECDAGSYHRRGV